MTAIEAIPGARDLFAGQDEEGSVEEEDEIGEIEQNAIDKAEADRAQEEIDADIDEKELEEL